MNKKHMITIDSWTTVAETETDSDISGREFAFKELNGYMANLPASIDAKSVEYSIDGEVVEKFVFEYDFDDDKWVGRDA